LITSSTIGEEKKFNPRIGNNKSKSDFVKIMQSLKLPEPAKIKVAVPANAFGGIQVYILSKNGTNSL
jgi:uncharacterized protein (TIGR01244 family)